MIQHRTALASGLVALFVVASISLARVRGPEHDIASESFIPPPPDRLFIEPSARPAIASTDGLLGVILARASVDIAPRFEGRVRAVHVRLGDLVAANGMVASLDVPSLRFDLRMAEAARKAAEVDQARADVELKQAEEQLTRRKTLSAEALASSEDLATAGYQRSFAEARVEAARAALAEKRARVEQFRQNTADTDIRAPFEGIVAARYVDPGANVTPATPIVRVISVRDLFVRFAVPEESASSLLVGAPVGISAGGVTLHGVVDKVAPEVDAASRMIIAEARLDAGSASKPVRSGEMVRVFFEEEPQARALP